MTEELKTPYEISVWRDVEKLWPEDINQLTQYYYGEKIKNYNFPKGDENLPLNPRDIDNTNIKEKDVKFDRDKEGSDNISFIVNNPLEIPSSPTYYKMNTIKLDLSNFYYNSILDFNINVKPILSNSNDNSEFEVCKVYVKDDSGIINIRSLLEFYVQLVENDVFKQSDLLTFFSLEKGYTLDKIKNEYKQILQDTNIFPNKDGTIEYLIKPLWCCKKYASDQNYSTHHFIAGESCGDADYVKQYIEKILYLIKSNGRGIDSSLISYLDNMSESGYSALNKAFVEDFNFSIFLNDENGLNTSDYIINVSYPLKSVDLPEPGIISIVKDSQKKIHYTGYSLRYDYNEKRYELNSNLYPRFSLINEKNEGQNQIIKNYNIDGSWLDLTKETEKEKYTELYTGKDANFSGQNASSSFAAQKILPHFNNSLSYLTKTPKLLLAFDLPTHCDWEITICLAFRKNEPNGFFESYNNTFGFGKFLTNQINKSSSFAYLDEQKILTIGSDKMQGLNKAHSPKLTQSITGITTLTFSLYTKYFDDKVQDFVENPFLDFLNNETKIKLNRNGEWFDFLIKSKEEDSEQHMVNYICKDIHTTSLGKQGFDITLSKDLFNNQGTVKELADIVLEESDWQQDKSEETGTETILEKREETLYKIQLYGRVGQYPSPGSYMAFRGRYSEPNDNSYLGNFDSSMVNSSENGKIIPMQTIYMHYSDLIKDWKVEEFVPCFEWVDELSKNDNGVIDDLDKIVYFKYEDFDKDTTFNENNREVTKYRSKKVVASNITKYIPELEKYIQVYEKEIMNEATGKAEKKEFYNYTDVDYITPELVSELMVNGGAENGDEGILSDEGWLSNNYQEYPLNFTSDISQKTDSEFQTAVNENVSDYSVLTKGYVKTANCSKTYICNTGLTSNKTIIKNLTVGDRLIVELEVRTSGGGGTPLRAALGDISICTIDYTSNGFKIIKKYSEIVKKSRWSNRAKGNKNIGVLTYELKIKENLTESQLNNMTIGLIISLFNYDSAGELKPYNFEIYRASMYKKVLDESGYLLSPNYTLRANPSNWQDWDGTTSSYIENTDYYNPTSSIPTSGAKVKYNIYNPNLEENKIITSAEDLIYEYQGYDTPESQGYIAKTINEKIRNIEANKSNRFNILQSLSEAFGCWCKFKVDHEEDGRIKLSNPPVRQEKYVSFHNFIGDLNPIGVKYGINEKRIQRNIESDSFTTKLIVQENVNQYAQNGVCTIARAKDNPSKDNIIYNLDYYIQMNLLGENVRKDLDNYLYKMNDYSKDIQGLVDQQTAANTIKISAEADFTTWDNLVNETEKELIELKSDFLETYNCSTDGLKTTTEWPNGIYKDKKSGEFVTGFKENFIYILTLETTLGNPSNGSTKATGYYLELQNAKAAFEKAKNKYENILLELDIISNSRKSITKDFNQKYGLYLQEGTWSSNNYIDDDLYYLDALQTLALSAKPKISYQISAIDLRNQEGYEAYNYAIGNRTTIEDTEFFGWTLKENDGEFIRTPYKEDIVMSEISTFLDDASQDTITVQNYREQFEDLFQKMSAETQALQFKEGSYDNAAGAVGSNGQILPDAITNTFNNASFIIKNVAEQGLVWDSNGITVTDQRNRAKMVRIAGGVIKISNNGDIWHTAIDGDGIKADVITAGILNITNQLNIKSGDNNAFTWNTDGINAYLYDNNQFYANNKITFNQYGLFGGLAIGTNLSDPFMQELANIHKNSRFALTWKGFSLKTGHADSTGYVSIDSDDDITLNVKPSGSSNYLKIIQIGHLESIASTSASDAGESIEPASQSSESGHYGIRVKDMAGNVILETTEKHVNGRFHINCGTW